MDNMLSEKEIFTMQKTIIREDEQDASVFFQAVGDITRSRIVQILVKNRGKELCVTDLARIIDCSLPAASQHMRILEHAHIVVKQRHGKMTCYQLDFSRPFIKNAISLYYK